MNWSVSWATFAASYGAWFRTEREAEEWVGNLMLTPGVKYISWWER